VKKERENLFSIEVQTKLSRPLSISGSAAEATGNYCADLHVSYENLASAMWKVSGICTEFQSLSNAKGYSSLEMALAMAISLANLTAEYPSLTGFIVATMSELHRMNPDDTPTDLTLPRKIFN
jgi:hypothetical protein